MVRPAWQESQLHSSADVATAATWKLAQLCMEDAPYYISKVLQKYLYKISIPA